MIGFIILSILATSHALPQDMPTFIVSKYSRSNFLQMSVAFENGQNQEIILEPYSENPCNFIGQLKDEPGSSIGVTGCLKSPEDKMYITLLSDSNTMSFAYIMDYYGKVSTDENPLKHQKGPSGIALHSMINGASNITNFDYIEYQNVLQNESEDYFPEKNDKSARMNAINWPERLYAYVKFGYDNTMAQKLREEGTTFNEWIDSVMCHVQTYYRHKSLPTKIEFKYEHSETIRRYEDLPNTNYLRDWSVVAWDEVKKNLKIDLFAAFGRDEEGLDGLVGIAWRWGASRQGIQGGGLIWQGTSLTE